MRRKHLSEPTTILNYRSPEGSQSIDNTEEFERVRKCVDEGKDPYEGRHSYCGFGMRRKHLFELTAILNRPSDRGMRYTVRRRGSEGGSTEPSETSKEDSGKRDHCSGGILSVPSGYLMNLPVPTGWARSITPHGHSSYSLSLISSSPARTSFSVGR